MVTYLESDVVELAAVADGRSARVHHAVHLHDARAAPRRLPGPLPRGAGRGFSFDRLLTRHFSIFFETVTLS